MGNRYLQVMPVALPAQVAPVAPVGFMYQNLDFVNPFDQITYPIALQDLNKLQDFGRQTMKFLVPKKYQLGPIGKLQNLSMDQVILNQAIAL